MYQIVFSYSPEGFAEFNVSRSGHVYDLKFEEFTWIKIFFLN